MLRALFEKTGNAVWMSHLDLMRLFQRAFKRAGLSLTHTQGFNPRPSVSIALPLSVGTQSYCELLDFDLEGQRIACGEICDRLNEALIPGVRVLQVYESAGKIRDLALLQCRITLEYDTGVPKGAVEELRQLFSRETLLVPKKTKNGIQQQDIIPMIRRMDISAISDCEIQLDALVCCQNPTLNPAQLTAAIALQQQMQQPDFCRYSRMEIYDSKENIFR